MPLYEFCCNECGNVIDGIYKSSERPEKIPCDTPRCAGEASYHVGKPAAFRIKYEQNGRVAYRYDMGDGKKIHRSATREKYEHTIGNRSAKDLKEMGNSKGDSVYTKQYEKVVRETEKTKLNQLKKAIKESK